ncbi:TNF receptor-associated factor 3-like isoform X2 [Dysidea avara]|uniref:TNF receptor-associated factor 3-like isoform X2 n=1 Tax=Dysidea avara TaxID=196820 RepID=UPI00332669D7
MAYNTAVTEGYDYEFVETPPDRLMCKICQLPCHEAQMSECCGHAFCKGDLEQMKATSSVSYACPMCRVEPFKTYPNKEIVRATKQLKIYCPNKKEGCVWIGELANVDNHLEMETHKAAECPCYCQYCDTMAGREVISLKHKENCHNYPLSCPNRCGLDCIPRCDMDEHKKVCPLEMILCPQCGVKMANKDQVMHNGESAFQLILAMCEKMQKGIDAAAVGAAAADDKQMVARADVQQEIKSCVATLESSCKETNRKVRLLFILTILCLFTIMLVTILVYTNITITTPEPLGNVCKQPKDELAQAKIQINKLENDIRQQNDKLLTNKLKCKQQNEELTQAKSLIEKLEGDIKLLQLANTKQDQQVECLIPQQTQTTVTPSLHSCYDCVMRYLVWPAVVGLVVVGLMTVMDWGDENKKPFLGLSFCIIVLMIPFVYIGNLGGGVLSIIFSLWIYGVAERLAVKKGKRKPRTWGSVGLAVGCVLAKLLLVDVLYMPWSNIWWLI